MPSATRTCLPIALLTILGIAALHAAPATDARLEPVQGERPELADQADAAHRDLSRIGLPPPRRVLPYGPRPAQV